MRDRLISTLGGMAITALMKSTTTELIAGTDIHRQFVGPRTPALYVLWHGRLLPCAWIYRKHRLGTLITHNRDGRLIAGMIERWGYRVVRGSSSAGALGAGRGIVELLRAGMPVAVTPDGPRGPSRKMKVGVLKVAQAAGVPIIPVSAAATRFRSFGRWDEFVVPMPRAHCPTALGSPVKVPEEAGPLELKRMASVIEASLDTLTDLVDEFASGRA